MRTQNTERFLHHAHMALVAAKGGFWQACRNHSRLRQQYARAMAAETKRIPQIRDQGSF